MINCNIQPKYDEKGLIPAIVQDNHTGQVLMMAYMNEKSLTMTLETGETVFWSRSRQELWHKGATSGNTQKVVEMYLTAMVILSSSKSSPPAQPATLVK